MRAVSRTNAARETGMIAQTSTNIFYLSYYKFFNVLQGACREIT